MSSTNPTRGPLAAVFDLNQPASMQALRKVVGVENAAQYVQPGRPFVVLMLHRPDGEFERIAFEGESQLREYYLATLRINATIEPWRRVRFVLRDLAPDFEDSLRRATQDLAAALAGTQGGT